jgi:hypothetical protein
MKNEIIVREYLFTFDFLLYESNLIRCAILREGKEEENMLNRVFGLGIEDE